MKALLAAGALAACFTTPSQAASRSPIYYSASTGNTYRAYYNERGWPSSVTSCNAKGGHLAVINTDSEWYDTVAPLIALDTSHDYWLGASLSLANSGTPQTVTGQPYYTPSGFPIINPSVYPGYTRYLDYSQPVQTWAYEQNAQTKYYVCEFEHAPI